MAVAVPSEVPTQNDVSAGNSPCEDKDDPAADADGDKVKANNDADDCDPGTK